MQLARAAIEAAARRLSGQLVATPVIGGVRLPGFAVDQDLRLKAELLQPGGSIWWRGIHHFLLRQFGSLRGLLIAHPPRLALVGALAAATHRCPVLAVVAPGAPEAAELRELGCDVLEATDVATVAEAQRRRLGYTPMPGPLDPEVALGLATVGLELAHELPADCERLFVASAWTAAVQAGWIAAGRQAPVQPVVTGAAPAGLGAALRAGHRLDADDEGLAVLAAALAAAGAASVTGVLISA